MKVRLLSCIVLVSIALAVPGSKPATSDEAIIESDGRYFDADENPTYKIAPDGTVDWYTYNGFRRYHSECHVCHGPDGLGSSFAPALAASLETLSYEDFLEIVVNGRERVTSSEQQKMPAFGINPNVMCYLDDIYVYLKARSDGKLGRGRPPKKMPKTDAAKEDENACFGD